MSDREKIEIVARAITERRALIAGGGEIGGCYAGSGIDCSEMCECMTDARIDALKVLSALESAGYVVTRKEPSGDQFGLAMLDIEDRRGPQRESKQVFREFYRAMIAARDE